LPAPAGPWPAYDHNQLKVPPGNFCHQEPSAETTFAVLPDFCVTVNNVPGRHLVALHGELDLACADDLATLLTQITGSTVVVDLADLRLLDSRGIDALVLARERISADGIGDLLLTRPHGIVRTALEILGLNDDWVEDWSQDWELH
jgi:anti-anti-sigma factor